MAKVGFLLDYGFEDSEMINHYNEIKKAGHEGLIIGLNEGEVFIGS